MSKSHWLVALTASSIGLAGTLRSVPNARRPRPLHEPQQQASPTGALAPRLQNLGTHTFPGVHDATRQAQLFINQGMNLAYAFNHAEARRAFREAARLDPNLAMAHWGQALVLGPNINAPMEPNEEPARLRARAEGASSSQVACDTARAGAHRRAGAALLGQSRGSRAARCRPTPTPCARCISGFPNDLDVAMLYVESVMDLRPWGYWQRDGTPHEGTAEIVALTERVMAKNPRHPARCTCTSI